MAVIGYGIGEDREQTHSYRNGGEENSNSIREPEFELAVGVDVLVGRECDVRRRRLPESRLLASGESEQSQHSL